MTVRLVVCIVCLLSVLDGTGNGAAGSDANGINPPVKQSQAAEYRDRARKRMEFNKCRRAGLPECYKQFQSAVDWCNENWEQCFPLIGGAGAHASNFGAQILKECKKKLEQKCREQSGL
ncbi:MAG: hypothetical protein V1792_20315 [Pseudomonadota bacterium]